jgi:hypothetical protein
VTKEAGRSYGKRYVISTRIATKDNIVEIPENEIIIGGAVEGYGSLGTFVVVLTPIPEMKRK